MSEHPEMAAPDEQTTVTFNLSRNSIRALETLAAEFGVTRTDVINVALQHLGGCRAGRRILGPSG